MLLEGARGLQVGPLTLSPAVLTTWGIMAVLVLAAWLLTYRLREQPGPAQVIVEGIVSAIESAVTGLIPEHPRRIVPFVGTLWIFILTANLVGIVPELKSPTGDLSVTTGLALLVFLSVHWFGIRSEGLAGYLKHYVRPSAIMLPFHLLSELTRTVALAVRLFGNIMSLEIAALIVLLLAGFLVPVPVLMLHLVEAIVQAYIFGMLALVYIAGAMQTRAPANRTRPE